MPAQKCGLEYILRIVVLVKYVPANAQNHGAMTHDQSPERLFRFRALSAQERVEQGLVRELIGGTACVFPRSRLSFYQNAIHQHFSRVRCLLHGDCSRPT